MGSSEAVFPNKSVLGKLTSPNFKVSVTNVEAQTKPQSNAFLHLLGGGFGGMLGALLTCPVEIVKTRMQSQQLGERLQKVSIRKAITDIYRNEGTSALWKGLAPTLVGVVPARALYFYSYNKSKEFLKKNFNNGLESPIVHLSAASISGCTVTTATNPLWFVKTRMQLDQMYFGKNHPNLFAKVVKDTYKEGGIRAFYRGISASYYGVAETAIQFAIYEELKKRTKDMHISKDLGYGGFLLEKFCSIFTAKLIACTATYPHEVIRTRMREPVNVLSPVQYTSFWGSFFGIWKHEGVKGLYSGLSAHLVRVLPNTAIIFMTYEIIVNKWGE